MYLYIVPTDMLTVYPLQWGDTPLHFHAMEGPTTCTEHLSTPGIDVNINDEVS